MGSRHGASEDTVARGIEDMIYVAVGKEVKECKSILIWALQNSGGKRIFILHVHQPAKLISLPLGGKVMAITLKENIVREHRAAERLKMDEILDEYLLLCRRMGVRGEKLPIEMDCIEKGIVELISQHEIRKLVMGAAAEKSYKRNLMEIRSSKAKYVCEQAPPFCRIQFICKGHLIFTREATEDTDIGQSNVLRSVSWGHNRESTAIWQPDYLPARSATLGHTSGSRILGIPSLEGTGELSSLMSRLDAQSYEERDGSSRSAPGLDCSTSSSRRAVDVTLTSWNENGLESKALYPAVGHSRSSSTAEVASAPPLQASPMLNSIASSISTCSSQRALSVADGSLDCSLYEQLEQAMEEAGKETLRRQKAEKEMIEARRRAQEEFLQRIEIEEGLTREKEELEKVKKHKDQLWEELRACREREISLQKQVGLLETEMDKLQMERYNALKETEELRKKQEEDLSRQMPEFSEFSLSEIEEATRGFDESLKIGQGGYGSIYKGLLRQTEVAIKRLETKGSQGTKEFQTEVRVLSQLRHPNLVKLYGYCQEVFALVYEYLPNGSLEDRLSCKDGSPPLSWQTRVRIATELCSVLVYLHSGEPHCIVHGDLKPSNILLDANLVAKLGDFGISRMLGHDRNFSDQTTLSHITMAKGTLAYIDPEFLHTGVLTIKSDVYSFGILILQMFTGKPPFLIANEVKKALDAKNLVAMLDYSAGEWPIVLAQKLVRLGLRCCEIKRTSRPDLGSDVLEVLQAASATCEASS